MKIINIDNHIINTVKTTEGIKKDLLSDIDYQMLFEFEDRGRTVFKSYPCRLEDVNDKTSKIKDTPFPVVTGKIVDTEDKRSVILEVAMLKFYNITLAITIVLLAGILLWTGYRMISLGTILPEALLFLFLCFWIPILIKRTHKKQVKKFYKEIEEIIVK